MATDQPLPPTRRIPRARTSDSGSVRELPGVGPARAAALARLGVHEPRDLLRVLPLRVEVAESVITVAAAIQARAGVVRVAGEIERTSLARFGRRSIFRLRLADATGAIEARFHNQPWLQRQLVVGARVELFGSLSGSPPGLAGPRIGTSERPLAAAGTATPLYPGVAGLSPEFVGKLCRRVALELADAEPEPVPAEELSRLDVPTLPRALRDLHAPADARAFEAARRRLALELCLELQARIALRRARVAQGAARICSAPAERRSTLRKLFPFTFTAAQERVAREIERDLARARPMRRLLQGDVGSGKTAIGAWAALLAAGAGGQVVFLAPTELLAEQHHFGLRELFERAGLRTGYLSGSLGARARRTVLADLASGALPVVFGTHAAFSRDVRYARLALAVVDEQHRFGVAQRGELFDKGVDVHVLLMSATPIPRTLALAWYGDLDTSVLDQKPPGRGPVTTRWVRGARDEVESFLRDQVAGGARLYWVVPRIGSGDEEREAAPGDADRARREEPVEKSSVRSLDPVGAARNRARREEPVETTSVRSLDPVGAARNRARREETAEARYARLLESPLAAHGIELVHGRMPPAERAARLARFRTGVVRTLVATTVIEVGVDVPEATLLVVEGAERLGLAQLHQLRGRVGRGPDASHCLLFGADSARRRFQTLERTTDGFEIAEEDLRQRGMGDLGGVRQAGANAEGFEEWGHDLALFHAAQRLISDHAEVRAHYASAAERALVP